MKKIKIIFNGLKLRKVLALCSVLCALCSAPMAARAAVDSSCDETISENDSINQLYALCSVHAYNIGADKNPEDANLRNTMNEVVALKTTIMTQQMKKQYDYLETTIKRFKIQLEKAVLTAQMEASGVSTENSGGGSGGTKNNGLSGTEDCTWKNGTEKLRCLQNNFARVRDAAFGNDVKNQIKKDVAILKGMITSYSSENKLAGAKETNANIELKCVTTLTKQTLPDCMTLVATGFDIVGRAIDLDSRSGYNSRN